MVHVFLVGSKGIPARYGGFETFVENLTGRKQAADIQYHVSCMGHDETHFSYNGADCFNVNLPLPGAAGRILHVSRVLSQVEGWCRNHKDETVIVYILGCRIGPLLIPHAKRLHKLGVKILCNPDGLEWKRDKWNAAAKIFLKYCEACLVKNADLAVCDSKNIERYIQDTYKNKVKATTYLAYGADSGQSECSDAKLQAWYDRHGVVRGNYYLIIGRFVPENNYATMLREFMKSSTQRDLVIITNVEHNKFYKHLAQETAFETDTRIKFVGTEYDPALIKKIREEAYGYLHGHEVGGTNPSLLEALASTKLNLLLDVGFNREVAQSTAFYWDKQEGNLAALIAHADGLEAEAIAAMGQRCKKRVETEYNWTNICRRYEMLFREMPQSPLTERISR